MVSCHELCFLKSQGVVKSLLTPNSPWRTEGKPGFNPESRLEEAFKSSLGLLELSFDQAEFSLPLCQHISHIASIYGRNIKGCHAQYTEANMLATGSSAIPLG